MIFLWYSQYLQINLVILNIRFKIILMCLIYINSLFPCIHFLMSHAFLPELSMWFFSTNKWEGLTFFYKGGFPWSFWFLKKKTAWLSFSRKVCFGKGKWYMVTNKTSFLLIFFNWYNAVIHNLSNYSNHAK